VKFFAGHSVFTFSAALLIQIASSLVCKHIISAI